MKRLTRKPLRLFSKTSDIKTVAIVTVCFVIAVVIYQLIKSGLAGAVKYPTIISPGNILNIFMQVSACGIMALGMTVVMLMGGIDLSVGMMTSMNAIFIGKCVMDWGISTPTAIVLGILLCMSVEFVLGFIISRLSVEPFIITLGGMIACRGTALLLCKSQEVQMMQQLAFLKTNLIELFAPQGVTVMGLKLNFPLYCLIFVLLAVGTWAILKYTKTGRRVYAVGSNRQTAYLSGINVKNMILMGYLFNGLCVGIGSAILLARINSAIISIGQNYEIDVIAAVVIGGVAMSGGKGSPMGAFLGAFLMGCIANAMNLMGLQSESQYLVKGLIIIIAVAGGAISAQSSVKKTVKAKELELNTEAQSVQTGT